MFLRVPIWKTSSSLIFFFVFFWNFPASNAQFEITGWTINANRELILQVPPASDHYYILLRGSTPTTINQPIDMNASESASVELIDRLPFPAMTFYQVEKVADAESRDSDQDGMPDTYELSYRPALDPLFAEDASIDADGDGSSNLQEYLA